jgi:uncharacterized membrane protein HdeD (DUF308 family)
MTGYSDDPEDWADDDDGRWAHIAPIYRPPVLRHRADPIGGASLIIALSLVGLVVATFTVGPPPWALYTITIVSAIGLVLAGWRWYRAVTAPRREKW